MYNALVLEPKNFFRLTTKVAYSSCYKRLVNLILLLLLLERNQHAFCVSMQHDSRSLVINLKVPWAQRISLR